ncbi:MAG: T9SS type A sorting domain-containing protein [bacterium]|nr:T9SS type A sorting domain-containing protein [bacterium]
MILRRLRFPLHIALISLLLVPAANAGLDVEVPGPLEFRRVAVDGSLELTTLVIVYGSEPDSLNVTLSPPGGPFSIVYGGGFISMGSTAAYAIRVAFVPTSAGEFAGTIDLGFGHGSFALSGSAGYFPDCGLSSTAVLFTDGIRHERSLEYVTITNNGATPMTLRPQAYEYNPFSVVEDEVVVPAGGSHALEVRYDPLIPIGEIGALDLGNNACPSVQLVGEQCGYLECEDQLVMFFEESLIGIPDKSPVGWPAGRAWTDERTPLTGYLYLRNPSVGGSITGFQMSVETDPELWLMSTEFPGGGTNVASGNDFRVVYSSPLSTAGTVLLATFHLQAAFPAEEAVVRLLPYSTAPGAAPDLRNYSTTMGSADATPNSGHDPIGWVEIQSISNVLATAAAGARLEPNIPNPFNPVTEIRWSLGQSGPCRVAVHDLAGRLVRVLCDEGREVGPHTTIWNGRDGTGRGVASGVYYVHLKAGAARDTQKITLLK